MTVTQASNKLDLEPRQVRHLCQQGQLKAVKWPVKGRETWIITAGSVNRLLTQRRRAQLKRDQRAIR